MSLTILAGSGCCWYYLGEKARDLALEVMTVDVIENFGPSGLMSCCGCVLVLIVSTILIYWLIIFYLFSSVVSCSCGIENKQKVLVDVLAGT
jgi:hypothetical protein